MTTFTLTGIAVTYDVLDDPASVGAATLDVTFPDNQAFINYTVIDAPANDLPEVDIAGTEPQSVLVNGVPLTDNSEDLLGFITTPQGTHIVMVFFDPATNTDYIFQIGGNPLTLPTTLEGFNSLDASITALGTATAPFAPGQNILLSSFLNVDITDSNTITGTDGDDMLVGTAGDDLIITGNATTIGDEVVGSAGDDIIDMSGNDGVNGFVNLVYGDLAGPISVTIDGGANTGTVVKGAVGTDTLIDVQNPLNSGALQGGLAIIGTAGNDTFNLTPQGDQWMSVRGGNGVDSYTINGTGLVRLDFRGGAGININLATGQVLNDGFGNVETIGGAGNVWEVRGSSAADVMVGSDANESFRPGGGNDTINGGGGFDRVRYDDGDITGVIANLATGVVTGTADGVGFTDTISNIERVRGSNGDDTLTGNSGANQLQGELGDDRLIGGLGDDTIEGGGGTDTAVLGVARADVVVSVLSGRTQLISSEGTDFFDSIELFEFSDGVVTLSQLINGAGTPGDLIVGTDGDDTLIGTINDDTLAGGAGNDSIESGGGGNNNISGSDGADTLFGGLGNDSIGGGLGDDTIFGDDGDDVLGAGFGNDSVSGGNGNDVVAGGAGNDTLDGGAGDDSMSGSFGNDLITGGDGDDDIGGGTGRDTIDAGAGNDRVGGGEGDDNISGGDGNDFLAGGGRDDTIDGGAGNDTINAGAGNDDVTGGLGADRFVFSAFNSGESDVVRDFEDGVDSFFIRIVNPDTGDANISNGGNGLAGFLTAMGIVDTVAGAQLNVNGHQVLVEGMVAADLTLDDFTFF